MPQKYSNVQFEFLSAADEASTQRGTVVERDGEMVLEVECPDDRPYVIVGKSERCFFTDSIRGYLRMLASKQSGFGWMICSSEPGLKTA
jgi:hypothetical protein